MDLATYRATLRVATRASIQLCSTSMLLPVLTDMTSTLMCFDPNQLVHKHSVFYFLHDLVGFRGVLDALFFYWDMSVKFDGFEERKLFESVCRKLTEAIDVARRKAILAMPSCTDFDATPIPVCFMYEIR